MDTRNTSEDDRENGDWDDDDRDDEDMARMRLKSLRMTASWCGHRFRTGMRDSSLISGCVFINTRSDDSSVTRRTHTQPRYVGGLVRAIYSQCERVSLTRAKQALSLARARTSSATPVEKSIDPRNL